MKPTEKSGINRRIHWVGAFFVCLFLIIIWKTIYLQVFQGQWLSRLAAGEYEKTLTIRGKRGTIFDRNLREMAVSVDAASIAAYPRFIREPGAVATALAEVL
ncbi:MAG: penicillin-binding protein 2, partial [Thermodesulfobacteriota bacterium]